MTVECSCAKQRPQHSLPDEKPGIHEKLNMMKTWSFIMSSSRSEAWDGVAHKRVCMLFLLARKTTIRFYDHEASWLPEYQTVII